MKTHDLETNPVQHIVHLLWNFMSYYQFLEAYQVSLFLHFMIYWGIQKSLSHNLIVKFWFTLK